MREGSVRISPKLDLKSTYLQLSNGVLHALGKKLYFAQGGCVQSLVGDEIPVDC